MAVPPAKAGAASAVSETAYEVGAVLGTAILGKKKGETASYEAPNGKSIEVTIISAKPYSA